MKKLVTLLLLLPFVFASCSNDGDTVAGSDEKGAISIGATIDLDIKQINTRAVDMSMFGVVIRCFESGYYSNFRFSDLPADKTVRDLEPGRYEVLVAIFYEDMVTDYPIYWGSASVDVSAGQTAQANVECPMTSRGIQFTVDQSVIDAGMVVSANVEYTDSPEYFHIYDNAEMMASTPMFFNIDSTIKVTIYDDGVPVKIDGDNDFKTISLVAGEWWNITLKVDSVEPETGSITLSAEIAPATPVEEELIIGGDIVLQIERAEVEYFYMSKSFDIYLFTGDGEEYVYLETFCGPSGGNLRPLVGRYTYSPTYDGGEMFFSPTSAYSTATGPAVRLSSGYMNIEQPDNLVETNYIVTGKVGYNDDSETVAFRYEGDLLRRI